MTVDARKPDSHEMIDRVVIGDCTLIRGDSLVVLPTLAAGSVDAVVTDPPYAVPTVVAQGRTVVRNAGDLSIVEHALGLVLDRCIRVVGDGGRFFIFCDGASYPSLFRAAYSRLSLALLIWDKGRFGMGREFRKQHELILHGWGDRTEVYSDGVGRPDVLRAAPVGDDRWHPAEKPVDLLRQCLEVCGDTILDPFMGSASTGVACIQMGKKFIGIEIDPHYFSVAVQRVRDANGDTGLYAGAKNEPELFPSEPS